MATLDYGDAFWVNTIPDLRGASLQAKVHLVFSLICFLKVSLYQILKFSFESDIKAVKDKASIFMGYSPTAGPLEIHRFPPALMLHLWSTRWPTACQKHFRAMITPYAADIALQESNQLITDPSLRIPLKEITVEGIQNILKPEMLVKTYREKAPFIFSVLHTFAASPNRYRGKKARKAKQGTSISAKPLLSIDDSDEEEDLEASIGSDSEWKNDYPGFSRNPLLVCTLFHFTQAVH
jgi:hypothetical protein